MTETLARIYVEQKNYDKAIQSYRILSLKYPEKSSFFADQIQAIKVLQEKNNIIMSTFSIFLVLNRRCSIFTSSRYHGSKP